MADNDDLMIEVTGSSDKAASALDKVIDKITKLQESFDKAYPAIEKFTSKMDTLASSSKAFSAVEKLTKGTGDLSQASKKAEADEAMYQARIDRATVSMEKSRVASERLADAKKKLQEYSEIDAHNKSVLSMSPEEYQKAGYDHTATGDKAPVKAWESPDAGAPSMKYNSADIKSQVDDFTSKIGGKSAKINIDTEAATAEVRKIGEYIDGLTPKIAFMSSSAKEKFNSIANTLKSVSQQLDNQRSIYSRLASESAKVAEKEGEGSIAYLRLEKQMLSASNAIDRLNDKESKLKTQLEDVTTSSKKTSSAMEDLGKKTESSGKKSSSVWDNTLRMMEKMFIRIAAFRIFSAAAQGITTGLQDMAQASNSANSTMSSLAASSLYLKNSFASALLPAIQAVTPSIVWLTNQLANLFNMLGMLGARVFGGATSFTEAKMANVNYAETLNKAGDSASDTKKKVDELRSSILGFDEINKLTEPTAKTAKDKTPGMPDPSSMFQDVPIPSGMQALGDKVKSFFEEWDKYAEPAKDSLDKLWKRLEPFGTFVAKGVSDFYKDFLKPLGIWTLGTAFPRFCTIVGNLANDINWPKLNKSLDSLWKALEPFSQTIGGGILWFLDNVLKPITEWAANNLAPAAIDLITAAIEAFDTTCQALEPTGSWLLNTFLKPLAEWTGGIIVSVINNLTDGLKAFSSWASENQTTVQNMVTLILGFLAGLWIYNTTKNLIGFIQTLGARLSTLGTDITIAGVSAQVASVGFSLLTGAILLLVTNWSKMNGIERVVGVLGAIAIAAATAAAAVGALQSAWSLGIAAAAIVAGTVAIAWSIQQANADAKKGISIPKMASGGLFTSSHLVEVGEGVDNEAILPLNSQVFSSIAKGIKDNGGASSGVGVDHTEQILVRMDKLESAIRGMKVALYTDDRTIAESAKRGNVEIARQYHLAT